MTTATEKAAELAGRIRDHLKGGGVLQTTGYGKSIIYDRPEQAYRFRENGHHVEVRRGKNWDAIATFYDSGTVSGLAIRFGRYAAVAE